MLKGFGILARLTLILLLLLPCLPRTASAAEKQITVAVGSDSVPYYFSDEQGRPRGLVVDLWRIWSAKTGVKVRFISADFAGTLELVRRGEADVHAGCFQSPAREKYLDFVVPVCRVATNFFVHRNVYGIKSLVDLRSLKIGVIDGDYALEYLKEKLPEVALAVYPDNRALFDAVAQGDVLAFVKDTAIGLALLSQKGLLQEFRYDIEHPLYTRPWMAAVKKGDRRLTALIRQGFDKISSEERARLELRWVEATSYKVADRLLIACPKDFAPFSLLSRSGRPAGMFVDIWRLWAKKTGKKVEFRFADWRNTLEEVRLGNADIHSGLFKTAEREQYLSFSQPFYEVGSRFFYDARRNDLKRPADLDGRRVGVLQSSFQDQYLRQHLPKAVPITYQDVDALLQAAVSGDVAAIFLEAPIALTALDRYGERGNFRILPAPPILCMISAGVRKGEKELLDLIQAGFAAMEPRELAEIESRWISDPEMRHFARAGGLLRFSREEKAWLADHKVIVLGGEADWPPLDFIDRQGVHRGVSADYLRLLGQRLGIRFEVVSSFPWAEMLEKAKERELAGAACIAENEPRRKFFVFTKPYFRCPDMIFTRRGHPPVRDMAELNGLIVAVEKGFYLEATLSTRYPGIKLLTVPNTVSALKAVARGEADAYLGNLTVANHLINRENITDLKVAGAAPWPETALRIGLRRDWTLLAGLLDRALDSITPEEHRAITRRWLAPGEGEEALAGRLELTQEEKTWLKAHPDIRLGVDPGWPPFEFISDKKGYSGMASDYVRLLQKKLDVKMRPAPDLSWDQAIAEAKQGRIDVFPCITPTPGRAEFLNFTKPYLSFPMVIVTRTDAPFIAGLHDLDGKSVAVGKGYASHEILSRNHAAIKLDPVAGIKEGLALVSQGKVAAFVGNLASITYFAREAGLANIKIAASTPYSFNLAIGVRKDWPELVEILDKAMASISRRERNDIHNAWISMRFEHGVDWAYVWRLVAVIGAVCLAVFGVFIFWNTRLQREVRQRKEAELALGKSEAHMRSLVESSGDAIIDFDLDRVFIDCNHAFSELFGFDKEEIVGRSVRLIHRDAQAFEEFRKVAYPVVWKRGYWRGEWIYRSKDGREAPMETTVSAYRTPDGVLAGYVAIIRDISERKKAEEELVNSRQRLAEIVDFLPDATLVIDAEGRVTAWNRALEELTGMPAEDMLGKGDYEYAKPFYGQARPILIDLVRQWDESVAEGYLDIKRVGDGLAALTFQPSLGQNGLYLASVARTLYDAAGRDAGAIESIRNITDQKEAELALEKAAQELERKVAERTAELQAAVEALQAEVLERRQVEHELRESEEEHRALLEASPNCVIAYDTRGRAVYVNRAFTRIFGWTAPEVIGKRIDFVPPENRPETLAAIEAVYQEGSGVYTFESRRLTKDGRRVDVSLSAAVFRDSAGQPTGLIVNLADITERKRAEEELRLYREELEHLVEARTAELEVAMIQAQEADRLKSAFLASMSHELRTPLNSIIGFTGIILQGLVGPLNEEQTKQMNMVKRSANHLLSLINDVLDISKIEAGQLTVESEVFDLGEVVREVEETLRQAAQDKGLELVCGVSPEVGLVVGDRRRVGQILINLLNNAIKFTERGGVYLDCRQKGGRILTTVRDTGIGVQPEDQDKLFKAFQQIDTGLTRRYDGTGLGLNICRKLLELLGGAIWMESEGKDKGSTFSFTLPMTGDGRDE